LVIQLRVLDGRTANRSDAVVGNLASRRRWPLSSPEHAGPSGMIALHSFDFVAFHRCSGTSFSFTTINPGPSPRPGNASRKRRHLPDFTLPCPAKNNFAATCPREYFPRRIRVNASDPGLQIVPESRRDTLDRPAKPCMTNLPWNGMCACKGNETVFL